MNAGENDEKLANLSRYIFSAPAWYIPLLVVTFFCGGMDLVTRNAGYSQPPATLLGTVPALIAFITTYPLVHLSGGWMTWNRSALLATSAAFFSLVIALPFLLLAPVYAPVAAAIATGFATGIRLLVLVAVADDRILHMVPPTLVQGLAASISGLLLFPGRFLFLSVIAIAIFTTAAAALVCLLDRPFRKAYHIGLFRFLNSFLAHLTDGSMTLDSFFQVIGEDVTVPQGTLLFHREGREDILLTVPNVHPGPLGGIGGAEIPARFQEAFGGLVLVPHGCATHDFNLVSSSEINTLIDAVRDSLPTRNFSPCAGESRRISAGSVSLLVQRFGEALLLVGTRSPRRTEDLEFAHVLAVMADARRKTDCCLFIDAHNCLDEEIITVHAGSAISEDYLAACRSAVDVFDDMGGVPFAAGAARVIPPFPRGKGFGDTGVSALVIDCNGSRTTYVLIDGNNIWHGVREELIRGIADLTTDAEVMTTDSHVVNTISAGNPVGLKVPAAEIIPYLREAVIKATDDLAPATCAGAVARIRGVRVFGPTRTGQLAATVHAMLAFLAPVAVLLTLVSIMIIIMVSGAFG